jgi:uncharacterized protein involved in exopolysaccharide biosynthesis
MKMEDKDLAARAILVHSPSLRLHDYVATMFRHRRAMLFCLFAVVIVPVVSAFLLPRYKGEMKFLVVRERVDPVVSPSAEKDSAVVTNPPTVSEEELNSEVELLNSHDLLKRVVLACDLAARKDWLSFWRDDNERIEAAVRELDDRLEVEPVRKTNVIQVTYKDQNSQVVGRVLGALSKAYLEKHREVHRFRGQLQFFEQETEGYRKNLELAENRLADFPRKYGVVAPTLDRDITVQKLNEFNASLQQTRASIAETENRIANLKNQASTTPGRVLTQQRRADNPQLLQVMKSTLLGLELKRSELLAKYQPDYRPVQELDKEIASTRAAIAHEDQVPVKDETTDVNPVQEWINSEMAKANADLEGLRGRADATEGIIGLYRAKAGQLEQRSIQQADLIRLAKAEESNFLLYLRKREEARITDSLDQSRILNVALAEEPTVPALPAHSPLSLALLTFVALVLCSISLVAIVHHADRIVRGASETELLFNAPVLAAVPLNLPGSGNSSNGHNNGSGHHFISFVDTKSGSERNI